jgi:5-methylcytosine-specific restriction endonuclease McrA
MPTQPTRHQPAKPREPWQRRNAQKRLRGRAAVNRRQRVAEAQGWLCRRCGELLEASYEVDHRVPLAAGGSDTDDNLQALHRWCHEAKTKEDRSRA